MGFIEGVDRGQAALLPPCVEDYVAPDALVRLVDAFVANLDLVDLGFDRADQRRYWQTWLSSG
jgi:transposase